MKQAHEPVEALFSEKSTPIDEGDGQRLIEKCRGLGSLSRDTERKCAPITTAALPANLLAALQQSHRPIELHSFNAQNRRSLGGQRTCFLLRGQGQACAFDKRHVPQGESRPREKPV